MQRVASGNPLKRKGNISRTVSTAQLSSNSIMEKSERELVTDLLEYFVEEIIPGDMIPYLTCLTPDDKELIQSEEKYYGPRKATVLLMDRIQRRRNGFVQFVGALERAGCSHLVDIIILKQDGLLEPNDPCI